MVNTKLHRRGLAAIVAAVCVLAQFATLAHRAAVHHVVCAEHGELVEAPAPVTTTGAIGSEVGLFATEPGSDAGDDHCVVACGLRAHTASAYPPAPVALQPAVLAAAELTPRDHVPSFARYRTAPKTSPPLA